MTRLLSAVIIIWTVVEVMAVALARKYMPPPPKNRLYWIPNNAGLFSHFLQMKIMARTVEELDRALIIAPTKSPHYGNHTIQMCSMFHMPPSVFCGSIPSNVQCSADFSTIVGDSSPDLCYNGHISFNANEKARNAVLSAVNLPPMLHLMPRFRSLVTQFELALRTLANHPNGITVVHWRRGDQLQGRCLRRVDDSVNCGSASELVEKVRGLSPHRTVYIATNERSDSPEMDVLRREGFFTCLDILSVLDSKGEEWSVFDILLAEVWLMTQADLFLAWGLSEINDVVEHDRLFAGKEHCVAQTPPQNEEQVTWCSQHAKRNNLDFQTITNT